MKSSTMSLLKPPEVQSALAAVPCWRRRGAGIARVCEFKDFVAAMRFVNVVARAAERAWHHPDVDIRWNTVTLVLCTHSAGGLTAKDFAMAARIDRLAARHKARPEKG
jgi:4a-hydroxytetrahydrobiopterin dehydratase